MIHFLNTSDTKTDLGLELLAQPLCFLLQRHLLVLVLLHSPLKILDSPRHE